MLEQEAKQKDRLNVSLLQIFVLRLGSIVMFDFSLEEGGIKPAAIQSWKRQDPLNLQ